MAIKTTEEQLEEVQAAITALMTGSQSYTIDGRTVTRASLEALEKREIRLKAMYAEEQGNRPVLSSINLSGMGYNKQ